MTVERRRERERNDWCGKRREKAGMTGERGELLGREKKEERRD